MAEVGPSFAQPPYKEAQPAPRRDDVWAPNAGGPVALVSDGSVAGDRMGWAALVASPTGVLATTCGKLLAGQPSSWVAE